MLDRQLCIPRNLDIQALEKARKIATVNFGPLPGITDEVSHGHRNGTLVSFYKFELWGCLEHID